MQRPNIKLGSLLAKVIAAALLFDALDRHAYDYYTLLRWIACGVCAFSAFQAVQIKKIGWLWIFGITAIILNPVAPLHFKRETWNTVDAAAGVLLLVAIVIVDIRKSPPASPSGGRQGELLSDQNEDVMPPMTLTRNPSSVVKWVLLILGFLILLKLLSLIYPVSK